MELKFSLQLAKQKCWSGCKGLSLRDSWFIFSRNRERIWCQRLWISCGSGHSPSDTRRGNDSVHTPFSSIPGGKWDLSSPYSSPQTYKLYHYLVKSILIQESYLWPLTEVWFIRLALIGERRFIRINSYTSTISNNVKLNTSSVHSVHPLNLHLTLSAILLMQHHSFEITLDLYHHKIGLTTLYIVTTILRNVTALTNGSWTSSIGKMYFVYFTKGVGHT